jgi:hypothetical protein
MPTDAIQFNARYLDLSARVAYSNTVAASPAAGSITTICTVTIPQNLTIATGVMLFGWATYTAGTSGISAILGIRQTNTTGGIIAVSNATTVVAASLYDENAQGFDTAPPAAGVYVLCLTVGSGSASSTVSSCSLFALVI